MNDIIKIKKVNFYHAIDNRVNTTINSYSGHGNIELFDDQFFTGSILNPTGLQPAIYFATGLLNGYIEDGSGFYNWSNLEVTGSGTSDQVYLNYITGNKPAQNIIEFINSNGAGLQNGDYISIQDFLFYYRNPATNPAQFDSPATLINNLNSGATGAFNNQGYTLLESFVGITGYQVDNKLFLFSYLREGENGNAIRVSREASNLNSIKIHNRYFTGGETYRPKIDSWEGIFSGIFNLTVENSGYYSKQIEPAALFGNISGLLWEDNFTGNYKIFTGLIDPRNPQDYSGTQILFNNDLNQFSGSTIIPANQSPIYRGLNIEIFKPNPYNISGNRFEYIISGTEIFYKGILEG